MSNYICSTCRQPCKPQLHYVGVVANCPNGCVEAPLLVRDEDSILDEDFYRHITEAEERDLADSLASDEQADWSAAEKARFRSMNR